MVTRRRDIAIVTPDVVTRGPHTQLGVTHKPINIARIDGDYFDDESPVQSGPSC